MIKLFVQTCSLNQRRQEGHLFESRDSQDIELVSGEVTIILEKVVYTKQQ